MATFPVRFLHASQPDPHHEEAVQKDVDVQQRETVWSDHRVQPRSPQNKNSLVAVSVPVPTDTPAAIFTCWMSPATGSCSVTNADIIRTSNSRTHPSPHPTASTTSARKKATKRATSTSSPGGQEHTRCTTRTKTKTKLSQGYSQRRRSTQRRRPRLQTRTRPKTKTKTKYQMKVQGQEQNTKTKTKQDQDYYGYCGIPQHGGREAVSPTL